MKNIINEIDKKIYLQDSWLKWNTTTIMAWVHGNEYIGIDILNEIINNIDIISWKVYFIIANLEAIKINKRQFEKNMNRCFLKVNDSKLYEDKRGNEIKKYLNDSDYLLDLHNTFSKQNSVKFLISEHKELWNLFNVPYIINWFDELHPWWSDWYMNNIWKKWICLESWSLYDIKWEDWLKRLTKNSIYNFLKYTWNIDWEFKTYKNKININFDYIYKNKTNDFRFIKDFKDFEKIKKWDLIWFDWKTQIISNYDWYILFAIIPNNIWDECFCLGK